MEIESPLTVVPVSKNMQYKYSKMYRRTKSSSLMTMPDHCHQGTKAQELHLPNFMAKLDMEPRPFRPSSYLTTKAACFPGELSKSRQL